MSTSQLLSGKFATAKLPEICAPRHALLNVFRRKTDKRIIFISAPAGYGKTVSTLLWLLESDRKSIWITLDGYDNTPSIFYKLFCAGILSFQPENKAMADIIKSPSFARLPVEHTISLLSEFIPDGKQYALVLDDMHLVTNEEIRKSGLLVEKRMPSSFMTLILTRNEIAEEYISVAGKDKVAVITSQDLAFSTGEIQKYFNARGHFITTEEASAAHAATNGWAIGVNALAMSGQMNPGQNGVLVLGDYIKTQIWDKWDKDTQTFLLKTSVLDEMTLDLVEKLTGRPGSKAILEKLCADNMFVSKIGEGIFRYHNLFLEFLRDMLEKQTEIDVRVLNGEAARCFYESGSYYIAMEYYIRCGNNDGITSSIKAANAYAEDLGVEEKFNHIKLLVNKVQDRVSDEFLSGNMFLADMFSWYYFLAGDARRCLYYNDILYANVPAIKANHPSLLKTVGFVKVIDFRGDMHTHSPLFIRDPDKASEITGGKKVRLWSLTQNLPFAHRSLRDYSEFAIDTETRLKYLKSTFLPFIEDEYYVMEDCVLAGLFYEKNLLAEAMKHALSAQEKFRENFGIELKFCLQMILMAVSRAMNKQDVKDKYNDIAGMLDAENAPYLRRNLSSYETKIKLWDGDNLSAKIWLDNYFVADAGQLEFYKIFQHFTTARANIVLAQKDKAMILILKLKKLAEDYCRPLDIAEASVLQAILEWSAGNSKEASDTLETALTAVQKYGFVRVFSDEGAAVLPILKKLAFNLKRGNYQGRLNAQYLNQVIIAAYEQSKRYKGIIVNMRAHKRMKLSKQQKLMIELLAKGYRNSEIVGLTGLTIHTVKSHQYAAYAKLGVNSAMDAVLKAKELGVIK